jgi:ActR/RegA family two-component response regulator
MENSVQPSTVPARPTALLLESDLFFITKIGETLRHAGYETKTARRTDEFARLLGELAPAVALVNTAVSAAARGVDWRAGIAAAKAAGVPVVAYGPHVELATQAEARAAGADRVIANSKLQSDLPGIVARAVRHPTQAPSHSAPADARAPRHPTDPT